MAAQYECWGIQPPLHIVARAIAQSLGVDFKAPESMAAGAHEDGLAELLAAIPQTHGRPAPTIADLAAAAGPVAPGGDTLAASRAAIQAMRG